MTRREYVGNAPATTLNGAITAVSAEIQITSGTNWPTGASFPFVVIVDRGLAAEEKILISSRTANTLFVSSRGFDSTTAASHASGATIEHGLSATDINEVNDHTFDTTNDDHTQYLNNARHDVEARHTFTAGLGTPAAPVDNTGETNTASAGTGNNPAREDHVHAWDDAAWQTWTPTLTNMTLGNGTVTARFFRVGRTIHYFFKLVFGSTSTMGTGPLISLPVAPSSAYTIFSIMGQSNALDAGIDNFPGDIKFSSGSTVSFGRFAVTGSNIRAQNITATDPFTWGTADELHATGTYEAAAGSS